MRTFKIGSVGYAGSPFKITKKSRSRQSYIYKCVFLARSTLWPYDEVKWIHHTTIKKFLVYNELGEYGGNAELQRKLGR